MSAVTGISGIQLSAASAAYAPTNSADVSAIASAYAESAVSSKLDESATADFYSTANPSGFITGVDLSNYATTAYVDSSVSSKLDTTAFNSGDFYSTSNPSGFITGVDLSNYATTAYVDSSISSFVDSAYVESQVSGKQDTLSFSYDDDKISAINGSALAGGGGGGEADWSAESGQPGYIENKPVPKTLVAGANISISEGQNTLTISAAAGLPASTSADEGKCLVVDSNGDPEWGTGGKTYTGTDGVVVDNVNDTVGLESPVDIVAGPGIVIDNPDGNTLRVSQADPTVDVVRDCENWNGHTMKCIILRGGYVTNTSMQNVSIDNVLPAGTTIAFIDGSNSYVVYGSNPQLNMMVPYCIDYNRLFSPWVDITNRKVVLRYIDVSNNVSCTYYLCVKYAVD